MHREHVRWFSPRLERDMDLLVFGHAGARVLVFPSSMGRFFEWEDQGMIGALAEQLERGWLQLYCVDSVDADSWYAKWKHPGRPGALPCALRRVPPRRGAARSRSSRNPNPFLITTGASFGAYHALTFALRYPHLVGRAIGLSGVYDIREITDGYTRRDGLSLQSRRSSSLRRARRRTASPRMRRMDIILAIGRDDRMRGNSEYFSGELWSKVSGNALRHLGRLGARLAVLAPDDHARTSAAPI